MTTEPVRSRSASASGLGRRALLAGLVAAAAPRPLRAAPPLRFGLTPVFLSNDLELLANLQAYLEAASGLEVELVTRRTYQEITSLLVSAQLDAAWICGYPFVRYQERLRLLAVPLWRGRPLYQSFLIVAADREVADLAALAGDAHAFADPDSNSGFLVTQALLAERGTSADTFFRETFFTYGHRNVIRAVAAGLADSGSVDGYVWEVMAEVEPALAAATRVAHRSEWLGFPPVAAPLRPFDPSRTEVLRAALVRMGDDPRGRAVLELLRLDRFAEMPPRLYDAIARKMERVRSVTG